MITTKSCARALLLFGAVLAASACDIRQNTAERLAHPAYMYEHQAPQGPFVMTTFERAREPGAVADVYIEGEGSTLFHDHLDVLDPTPTNPVALHLATRDDAANVIYLAQPCQYAGLANGDACPMKDWTTGAFAPAMVAAENAALDDLKARYHFSGFNLIGYSTGGGMAVLLAARRDDVRSLRTVAPILDARGFAQLHDLPPPAPGMLDPVAVAPRIARLPQHHFLASWEDTAPPSLFDRYRAASGPTQCIRVGLIADSDHDSGWVDKWPALLKAPLDCHAE